MAKQVWAVLVKRPVAESLCSTLGAIGIKVRATQTKRVTFRAAEGAAEYADGIRAQGLEATVLAPKQRHPAYDLLPEERHTLALRAARRKSKFYRNQGVAA